MITPEMIADVAQRMGWRADSEGYIDRAAIQRMVEDSCLTADGIVALLEWALVNGHDIFKDARYCCADSSDNPHYADSLAECLIRARMEAP